MFNQEKHFSNDLATLLTNYSDEWVALNEDQTKVVGHGKSLHEAMIQARKNGCQNPTVTRVPEHYCAYVL